jgi:hypothetical protein
MPQCDEKKESVARVSHVRFRLFWRYINQVFLVARIHLTEMDIGQKKEFSSPAHPHRGYVKNNMSRGGGVVWEGSLFME